MKVRRMEADLIGSKQLITELMGMDKVLSMKLVELPVDT